MVRITLFLLLLLLRNNAYAYCYATQWTDYGPVFSSLGVAQGTTLQACQQLACQLYPSIPECGQPVEPPCQDIAEFQSIACQPNYSGAINQSRTKTCSNNQWTDWTTTSDNCTPNPPTCIESTETRTLGCLNGFEGSIQEQRSSICSDPYGSPTWTVWSEIYNTCKMTATNLNNPTSPVSPISPMNPNRVVNQGHYCTHHSTRTCNCSGHDCIDNDNRNSDYFGSHSEERNKQRIQFSKYYDDAGYRESARGTKG
jgi:hypothetical protein